MTCQGESYTSLSTAGGVARVAAGATPLPGRKVAATDGWNFWRFTDADGQEQPINVLRQRYLAERDADKPQG